MSITPEQLKAKHEKYSSEKADVEFLKSLKFAELRYHLGGSITANIALAVAKKANVKLPTYNKKILRTLIRVTPGCKSLTEFLKHFDMPESMLKSKEGISEAVYQCQEHCKKNRVFYMEIRFAPQIYTDKGLTQREVIEAALEGLKRSDLKSNIILCLLRGKDTKAANLETIELCKEFIQKGTGVVGLDLAGDETHFKTKDYKEEFELAKKYGIPFTITAGESGSHEEVDTAIEFGCHRIGHAIHCVESEETMKNIKEKGIILEICPFSNFCTNCGAVENYPFKTLLDKGIKMCLNTDDLAIIGNNLIDEFAYIITHFDVTKMQVIDLIYNAIEGSFASEEMKAELRKVVDEL